MRSRKSRIEQSEDEDRPKLRQRQEQARAAEKHLKRRRRRVRANEVHAEQVKTEVKEEEEEEQSSERQSESPGTVSPAGREASQADDAEGAETERHPPKRRREVVVVRRRRKRRRTDPDPQQLDPLGLATSKARVAANDAEARSNPEVTTTTRPRVQLRDRAACDRSGRGNEPEEQRSSRSHQHHQHHHRHQHHDRSQPQHEDEEPEEGKAPVVLLKRRDEVSRRSTSDGRSGHAVREPSEEHSHRRRDSRRPDSRRPDSRRPDSRRRDSCLRQPRAIHLRRAVDSRSPPRSHPVRRVRGHGQHLHSDSRRHRQGRESPLRLRPAGAAPSRATIRRPEELRLLPREEGSAAPPIGSGSIKGGGRGIAAAEPLASARIGLRRGDAPRFGSRLVGGGGAGGGGRGEGGGRRVGLGLRPPAVFSSSTSSGNIAKTAAQLRTSLSSTLALLSMAARLKNRFGKGPRGLRGPIVETSTRVQSLLSGGVVGPLANRLGSGWELPLDDDQRRSFVSYCRGAIPFGLTQKWYRELLRSIDWNQPKVGKRLMPRSAAWLTDEGCRCTYRYGGTAFPAHTIKKWFSEITDYICKVCGIADPPNSCNANLYEDGMQSVGWHADDEALFEATTDDALIISLSLGAARIFEVRPKDDPGCVTRLELRGGDICTMEGLMQKNYEHRIPPQRNVQQGRINLTWRWIRSHQKGCPCVSRRTKRPFAALPSAVPVVRQPAAVGLGFKRPRLAAPLPRATLPLSLNAGKGRLPLLPSNIGSRPNPILPRPHLAAALRPPIPVIGEAPDEDEAKRLRRAERFKEGAPATTAGAAASSGADAPDTRHDRQGLLEVWDPFVHGGWKRHGS